MCESCVICTGIEETVSYLYYQLHARSEKSFYIQTEQCLNLITVIILNVNAIWIK